MRLISDVLLKDADGKILLQFRDGNAPQDTLQWSLFGGAVNVGEEPIVAACREIEEELTLVISPEELTPLIEGMEWVEEGEDQQYFLYEYNKPIAWGDFTVLEGAGAAFLTKEEILQMQAVSDIARTAVEKCC